MDIRTAAGHLYNKLRRHSWFAMVGIGIDNDKEALLVYVKSARFKINERPPKTWEGYPVIVKNIKKITPASPSPIADLG